MQAKCGTCQGTHDTIAEYRTCAGAPTPDPVEVMDNLTGQQTVMSKPSDKQVRYALDLLESRVWPDTFTEADLKGMERRQVSDLIDGLFKAKRKTEANVRKSDADDKFADIPDGRYALEFKDGWKFFQVKHGHTRTFTDLLIGAPGSYRHQKMYGVVASKTLTEIRRITPRQASINFGLQSETCGVCSSPLTNPDSIKLGIGPVCRGKMGW